MRRGKPFCGLCGAAFRRASRRDCGVGTICEGCAERLELDLTLSVAAACPDCGRHRELCRLLPCTDANAEPAAAPGVDVPVIRFPRARRVSGRERVQAIENLAASRLGVRELSRRTGFAPPTISRWLKIDRRAVLKHALAADVVDIGRAKLLADAPEESLGQLIEQAPRLSRTELASRVAALRAHSPAGRRANGRPDESRQLRTALALLESITELGVADHSVLERLEQVVDDLCRKSASGHQDLSAR